MENQTQSVRHESRRLIRELGFLRTEFAPAELTHQQCHTILETGNYEGITSQDLCNYLNLDKSTISRVVMQLQSKDLVGLKQSPFDKRKKVIRLTEKGERKFEQINERADEIVKAALDGLSKNDIKKIIEGMQIYAEALRRARRKMEFRIRLIEPKDNDAVRNLIHTVMPEFGCDAPGFAMRDPEVKDMYLTYTQPKSVYFVLEHGNEVVGGAGVGPLAGGPKNTCELRKMYFLPSVRGTGMGRELLDLCLKEARKLGYKKCYLETARYMTQAQRLYNRANFKQLSKPMGRTGHTACDRWYLRQL